MVFSSNEFLFLYLPLSFILYFLSPVRYRNLVLFAVSLVFYGWEKPIYLLIMVFIIIVNYLFGYLIDRAGEDSQKRKNMLIWGVVINLATLGFFKYTDFLILSLSKIPFLSFLEPIGVQLPIGISFYTFQSMSYIIDVYRGTSQVQRKFVNFGAYVSMFPQLIAGPIVRYSDIDRELNGRKHTVSESADGARRFVIGLAKKVLLADVAGAMWEQINAVPREQTSVLLLWLGIILYAFQIYFDFSGYSDMGIGLGKILGFHFPENFNYPYISKSITEFWRRWHMTLSTWFKEYVYIPLGGNRRGTKRLVMNLLIVWLLTGLWHGASWNFVLWGFYYFALLVIEKLFLSKWLDKIPSAFSHLYALFFILIGWLIFYFKEDFGGSSAFSSYFAGMLGLSGLPFSNMEFGYTLVRNFLILAILCFASTPYPREMLLKIKNKITDEGKNAMLTLALDILLVCVFALCIVYISSSDYRPNIYFEF
ncbi:MAG: MBOAT family protein [Clostridia bacterium]|nr:MBOAT family protein [Clostridia bacterium]